VRQLPRVLRRLPEVSRRQRRRTARSVEEPSLQSGHHHRDPSLDYGREDLNLGNDFSVNEL